MTAVASQSTASRVPTSTVVAGQLRVETAARTATAVQEAALLVPEGTPGPFSVCPLRAHRRCERPPPVPLAGLQPPPRHAVPLPPPPPPLPRRRRPAARAPRSAVVRGGAAGPGRRRGRRGQTAGPAGAAPHVRGRDGPPGARGQSGERLPRSPPLQTPAAHEPGSTALRPDGARGTATALPRRGGARTLAHRGRLSCASLGTPAPSRRDHRPTAGGYRCGPTVVGQPSIAGGYRPLCCGEAPTTRLASDQGCPLGTRYFFSFSFF